MQLVLHTMVAYATIVRSNLVCYSISKVPITNFTASRQNRARKAFCKVKLHPTNLESFYRQYGKTQFGDWHFWCLVPHGVFVCLFLHVWGFNSCRSRSCWRKHWNSTQPCCMCHGIGWCTWASVHKCSKIFAYCYCVCMGCVLLSF